MNSDNPLAAPPPPAEDARSLAPGEHYEQLKCAVDAADQLMAGYMGRVLPVEAWRAWRREHREALCDPFPPVPVDDR